MLSGIMMLVNVDSMGYIIWMRPIMHDNNHHDDSNIETDIVANGKDIILLTNEARNESDTYNPGQPTSLFTLGFHGAISAYRFTPDGQVTKRKLIPKGDYYYFTTPLRRQADGHYTFIISRVIGFIAELTIR